MAEQGHSPSNELIIDDDLYRTNKSSVSFKKYLEQAVENKTVSWIMDVCNMGLQLSNLIVYCVRTHDMCAFERKPLWKIYIRTLPDGSTEFWDREC